MGTDSRHEYSTTVGMISWNASHTAHHLSRRKPSFSEATRLSAQFEEHEAKNGGKKKAEEEEEPLIREIKSTGAKKAVMIEEISSSGAAQVLGLARLRMHLHLLLPSHLTNAKASTKGNGP